MQILKCIGGFSANIPLMGFGAGWARNGSGPDPQPKPVNLSQMGNGLLG